MKTTILFCIHTSLFVIHYSLFYYMLPPGHAAAGLLVAQGIISLSGVSVTPEQTYILLGLGAFSAFAPDLDMFWAFAQARGLSFGEHDVNHRASIMHTPLFWIFLGALFMFLFPSSTGKLAAVVITAGALSHFVLDSFKMGIRWFWPISSRYFAFMHAGEHHHYQSNIKEFFKFWLAYLKFYASDKTYRPTFLLEVAMLTSAALLLMTVYY